ncbi:hypothetical protein PR048_016610 [Dryococelus australis]|uniref:Uncharacterized protein n=1 Tax=Dryococelus australis TaxID=614101 RepID=A0ABQ9H7A1_9NEOP|nr:hypothetical protein PR048_016610 [Dryococelus australis]
MTLPCLRQVAIPSYILKEQTKLSLHIFANANQHTYATVIFLRVESSGDVELHLVEARARLAPLKKTTIPWLELLAAIAAILAATLPSNLQLKTENLHSWSDSTSVILYIQCDEQWSVFVYNRVQEIQQLPKGLGNAEVEIVKLIQKESFHGPEDRRLSSLRSYEDDCRTLHLRTTISGRKGRPEFRHPAVLPAEHHVVERLIYSLYV